MVRVGHPFFCSYEINIPNGGTSRIIGNIIEQSASSVNAVIIDFHSEAFRSRPRSSTFTPAAAEPRRKNGPLDIGAYEFVGESAQDRR